MGEAEPGSDLDRARWFVARAPMYMSLLDLEGRHLEVSRASLELFVRGSGNTRDQLINRPIAETYPEVSASVHELLERLAAGEAMVEFERVHRPAPGVAFHLRSQASYWRDDQGRPIAVLVAHQDIDAEVRTRDALAESEARLRAVVDHLPTQIALSDLESGRVLLMNEKMCSGFAEIYGVPVGGTLNDLNPAALEHIHRRVAEAEATKGVRAVQSEGWEGRFADRTYRVKYVVFRDRSDRRQLLWIAEDVTELREATLALERAAAEAEAASRAKSEFLANMSHEIRTPLNGVMGVAGALARTPLAAPQQEMVEIIETSARTLETLLSDILDLARIEAGKMELRPEPFDLAGSVRACAALFDAAAQEKGLDLEVAIEPAALGGYVGDSARLRQILSNLLGNAVKFTNNGRVSLRVSTDGPLLKFEVRDTGIGFDAETKARLFSRFEQADGSITRRFGGSGLGLSISRSLAEAMGGALDAEAQPGHGSVFTLTLELPRCALDCDGQEDGDAPEAPEPLAGMRVLVAEDHPTNRRVVELILGAAGVELTCVENGAEAVEAFSAGDFDLILMDMQMPVMDGLTAIREIRRIEALQSQPPVTVFVLTANAMPDHISASLAAGADGHLPKPIQANTLLARVLDCTPGAAKRPTGRRRSA